MKGIDSRKAFSTPIALTSTSQKTLTYCITLTDEVSTNSMKEIYSINLRSFEAMMKSIRTALMAHLSGIA